MRIKRAVTVNVGYRQWFVLGAHGGLNQLESQILIGEGWGEGSESVFLTRSPSDSGTQPDLAATCRGFIL